MNYLEQIHHQTVGHPEGPKLVFLHGLIGSGLNWRSISKAFENKYQILLLDQRGHGKSFQPASGYGSEDYAGDLKGLLDQLGWDKIHLVGHSMGGRNALAFAHLYPEQMTSLVIEDIGPDQGDVKKNSSLNYLDVVPVPFTTRKQARDFFKGEFQSKFPGNPFVDVIAAYLYSNIVEVDGQHGWRFFEPGIRESIQLGRSEERWAWLQQLQVPTLVVRGEQSDELSPQVYQKMLESNDLVQGVEIPNSGHWVHFDQPEAFINTLNGFLSGL